MSFHISELQQELNREDIELPFVSFRADPDYDHPEVLKEYGEQYDADFDRWTILTGYDFQTIKELSIKSFRVLLKEPEDGSNQVMHDARFFLVNPEGEVIKG